MLCWPPAWMDAGAWFVVISGSFVFPFESRPDSVVGGSANHFPRNKGVHDCGCEASCMFGGRDGNFSFWCHYNLATVLVCSQRWESSEEIGRAHV